MAGLVTGISNGLSVVDAFKCGLAGGISSCYNTLGTEFAEDSYTRSKADISVTTVTDIGR